MKNLAFVLWMLGFPIVISVSDYFVLQGEGKIYSHTIENIVAVILLVLWGFVGYKLYEPNKK